MSFTRSLAPLCVLVGGSGKCRPPTDQQRGLAALLRPRLFPLGKGEAAVLHRAGA